MLEKITPLILTRDEEANIGRTLEALRWAADVVVLDSLSTDATKAIASRFPNVRVVERAFDDLATQTNFGLGQLRTEWALSLDADHVVSQALVDEMRSLEPLSDVAAYIAPFGYAVRGRRLRRSLYPPRPVLLRRSRCTYFMDGHAHRVRADGRLASLRGEIVHDDRKPFSRFLERQQKYMREEADKIRRGENLGLSGRIRRLRIVAPLAVVVHTLFIRGLILDGVAGLLYAWERFVAELMLSRELMRRRSGVKPSARSSDLP